MSELLKLKKPLAPYIYICGAGPGDVGLLTLKTYHVLTQHADCVIYDRLISDELLELIPEGVTRIYAGKSCRTHHMTQDEINDALVHEARKGQVVVRLKGGDPFIFGRGGEEAHYISDHTIPYEVIPGVNAADGCAAYHGIPLTHRGVSSSVLFLTGHQQKGQPITLDWDAMVKPDRTLVIYMGLTHLEEIAYHLIQSGMDPNTLSTAIEQGTTVNERRCIAPIKDLFKETQEQSFKAPTLIIIGNVVQFATE